MKRKLFLILIVLLLAAMLFSSCNSNDSSDNIDNKSYEYHNENVEVLASVLDASVASSVVAALEKSCAIEEKTKLVAQDLIKVDDNCYELYAGLTLRLYIDNGHISLYTFETTYSEYSKILLYDSFSQDIIKVLTVDERNNLIHTQRRATVHSTVAISPCEGILLHNALGSTKIDLTFTNKSDSKITYLNIVITPFMSGTSFSYNNKAYVLDCDLPVSGSVDKSISTTGWTNYDSYKITQVTVMFSDGSTIGFNSFDCQFLDNTTSDTGSEVPSDKPGTPENPSSGDDALSCAHELNQYCICVKCSHVSHTLNDNYQCEICKQGSLIFEDNFVYFGSYPQSLVTDDSIIKNLIQSIDASTETIKTNWISYNYCNDNISDSSMYYIDVEYNDLKYRGVFINAFRKNPPQNYEFEEKNIYWFKFEPLKWKIISNSNQKLELFCETIIDAQEFNYEKNSNNWEFSTIRKWLNKNFYNTAFDDVQKNQISAELINNKTTAGFYREPQRPPFEPYYDSSNQFASSQNNTVDKVYLLSSQDVYNIFGFTTDSDSEKLQKEITDYTKIQGCYTGTTTSTWMLRSPCRHDAGYFAAPTTKVSILYSGAVNWIIGVIPVITISLN